MAKKVKKKPVEKTTTPKKKTPARPKKKKLTTQERLFIAEYLIDFNPERAALAAEYAKTTAHSNAYVWTSNSKTNKKPHVYAEIQRRIAKKVKKAGITAEMVIAELGKIGFSNIQDFLGDDNAIADLSKLNRKIVAAVDSIEAERIVEYDTDGNETGKYTDKVKIRLHSKTTALRDLGKHLGIFERDNAQMRGVTLADIMALAMEKNANT